jgi:hypothetical protein
MNLANTTATPSKVDSPIRHFEKPREVPLDPTLSQSEMKKALDTWEIDAQALQRAEDEGMGGGEPTELIETHEAKKTIGAESVFPKAK